MTSKERVLAAINHEEPDRVPVAEMQYGLELLEPLMGAKTFFTTDIDTVKAYWSGKRDEIINQRVAAKKAVLEKFGWDIVLVSMAIGKNTPVEIPVRISESDWQFADGSVIRYSTETSRFLKIKDAVPPSNEKSSVPVEEEFEEPFSDELEEIRTLVNEFGKTRFICAGPLQGHPKLRFSGASSSVLDSFVNLYEEPEKYRDDFLKKMSGKKFRKAVEFSMKEGLDGIFYSSDYGYNAGPFVSPEMFRKVIFPGLQAFCDTVHSFGLVAMLHSCGNNKALMDSIVEAGVDVYQAIQPEMDIITMKKRYGKNITLWGGVAAGDLVSSTPERIKEEAKKYLAECKPGGGYIFGTSHSIMPGAKYENYIAMMEAYRGYGCYCNEINS